jgi:hypothetical protein
LFCVVAHWVRGVVRHVARACAWGGIIAQKRLPTGPAAGAHDNPFPWPPWAAPFSPWSPHEPPQQRDPRTQALARNVRDALMEDIGRGDWTAQLVPAGRRARAQVVAKEAAVICGRPWFDACVLALDPPPASMAGGRRAGRGGRHRWSAASQADARALLSAPSGRR